MKTTYALTLALIATAALGEICDRTKSDGGCECTRAGARQYDDMNKNDDAAEMMGYETCASRWDFRLKRDVNENNFMEPSHILTRDECATYVPISASHYGFTATSARDCRFYIDLFECACPETRDEELDDAAILARMVD